MRAVVARKLQPVIRRHQRKSQARENEITPLHQSSFTARTGPMPVASLPDNHAVTAARHTRTREKPTSSPYGGWRAMLQFNDWRVGTWGGKRGRGGAPPTAAGAPPTAPQPPPRARRAAHP